MHLPHQRVGTLMVLLVVGCTELVQTDEPTHVEPEVREWVSVTPYPCAMDTKGMVACWSSEERVRLGQNVLPAESGPADSFYTGVDSNKVLGLIHLGRPIELASCLSSPGGIALSCRVPDVPVVDAKDGAALTPSGAIRLWHNQDPREFPSDRTWHALTKRGLATAVDEDNVLSVLLFRGFADFPLDPNIEVVSTVASTLDLTFQSVETGACVLDTAGDVTCMGEGRVGEASFPNGPYRFLSGAWGFVCAVRAADSIIECNDDRTYDLGSIRDFSAETYVVHQDEPPYQWRALVMCAITMDNAIRCEGPRYTPDLVEQLDNLPR